LPRYLALVARAAGIRTDYEICTTAGNETATGKTLQPGILFTGVDGSGEQGCI
jgi:hypothetical protein